MKYSIDYRSSKQESFAIITMSTGGTPGGGVVNKDGAYILYNTAFIDTRISGCWRFGGDLAGLPAICSQGGVKLDVIDSVLEEQRPRQSVNASVNSCGRHENVRLWKGVSPESVAKLAIHENRKWPLFFY